VTGDETKRDGETNPRSAREVAQETADATTPRTDDATVRRIDDRLVRASETAPRTDTAGETAHHRKTGSAGTDRKTRDALARLCPTAPASSAPARPLHLPLLLQSGEDAHDQRPDPARPPHASAPRSPFPHRRCHSVGSTTPRNPRPNMEARRQTRRSPTSRLRVR
jgi:hypothetical protein